MNGTPWAHDDLALDLARSREGNGEAVATRLSLGSRSIGGQVDVAALKLSWTRAESVFWEVKVNRSDFLSDVGTGKYERYLRYCHRLYFAVPSGLVKKAEVPEGIGLVVRGENGWSGVRAARRRQVEDTDFRTLLMSHVMSANPGPWAGPSRLSRLRQRVCQEVENLKTCLRSEVHGELQAALERVRKRERDLAQSRLDALREIRGSVVFKEDDPRTTGELFAEALAVVGRNGTAKERRAVLVDERVARQRLRSIVREAERALELLPEEEGSEP